MSWLDQIKALITPEPESARDSSWPRDETPGYYEDTSVQTIVTGDAPPDTWAPTEDQKIPYRGVAEHGVPFDSSTIEIAPTPQAEALEHEHERRKNIPDTIEVPVQIPVLVSVVDMPEPPDREMRVVTTQWNMTAGDVFRICPRRNQRTQLTLASKNGNCLFSSTETAIIQLGFPIPTQNAPLQLDTTQDIHAVCTTATDIVYVLETFPVDVNEVIS